MRPRMLRSAILGCLALVAGCKSPPAPSVSVLGLWPEQPPLRYKPYNFWTGGKHYVWPKVQSKQPILRWQTFPLQLELASDTNGFWRRVNGVTYDLQIWLGLGEFPAQLVYERTALTGTLHQVEQSLERRKTYFWTVRARFRVGDQTRVTEWSRIASPEPGFVVRREGFRYPDQRYYRFRTP